MSYYILHVVLGLLGIGGGILAHRLRSSALLAAFALSLPIVGYCLAWSFRGGDWRQIVGTCLVFASAPATLGYAIHVLRRVGHRPLAWFSVVTAGLLALPLVWLLPINAMQAVRQLS